MSRRAGRLPHLLAAYGIGVACLAWVLHGVDPRALAAGLHGVRWGWIAPAIAFDILSYVCQGWRWRLLLEPGEIGTLQATQAIYAGLFINEVLPMRAGEVARAWLVSRWMGAQVTSVVPSIVLERLLDGLWLALALALTAMLVPLPGYLVHAGDVLGTGVLAGVALFILIVLRGRIAPPAPSSHGLTAGLRRLVAAVEAGVCRVGLSRRLCFALGISGLLLLAQMTAFWLVAVACGLRISFWVGCAVLLVVHLGTALPNAPANVGTYQFFVVVGLGLFGVDKVPATSFAFIVFALLTVPLWVLGLLALGRSGMTVGQIRRAMA